MDEKYRSPVIRDGNMVTLNKKKEILSKNFKSSGMGSIGIGYKPSSSDFDEPRNTNPDPSKYEILEIVLADNGYIILKVKYVGCTNYEGIKILLFDNNVTVAKLWSQNKIDPHFSKNKDYYSPIARFEPTERGMEMAKKICEIL